MAPYCQLKRNPLVVQQGGGMTSSGASGLDVSMKLAELLYQGTAWREAKSSA